MMNSKRESRDIVIDMLKLCRVPQNKTAVVYGCNLNFSSVNQYLTWCHIHGWMLKTDGLRGVLYGTTELGKTYLRMIEPVLLLEEKILIDGDMT